jgi:uncharacterized protein YaiE (UPF0345 family)
MSTTQIDGVSVQTQANVYFDGQCVSYTLHSADGTRKSVGVILTGRELAFNTGAPEIMECVAGKAEYRLSGTSKWETVEAGGAFKVGANSVFDIRIVEPFHYICHYG